MMEWLAEIFINGVLTLLAELSNVGLRKSLRAPPDTDPLSDALVGAALGFVLGLASVYFFPVLALRMLVWQWLNALLSPLAAGVLIVLWRSRALLNSTNLARPSSRVALFQAFVVGLAFNLSRLLFGH